jgi:hypothetical protein
VAYLDDHLSAAEATSIRRNADGTIRLMEAAA